MLLKNKRFVVTGIVSKSSIAWGIAEALHREGASLILTYPNDGVKKRLKATEQAFDVQAILPCDVSLDDQIEQCFAKVAEIWEDGIDGVIHAIGFAPQDEFKGNFVDACSRQGFQIAHDISSYSLIALAKYSQNLLSKRQGSLLTLTYAGSQKVVENYHVMGLAKASLESGVRYLASSLGALGIRVNAISAGPVLTFAASAIPEFQQMLNFNAKLAPLKRNVSLQEIGNTAVFLLSPWASGITGEILFVDCGANIMAISPSLVK